MQPPIMDINIVWLFQMLFYVLVVIFLLHVLSLAYHWFTYGSSRKLATTALTLYLGGGILLFLVLGTSIHLLTP